MVCNAISFVCDTHADYCHSERAETQAIESAPPSPTSRIPPIILSAPDRMVHNLPQPPLAPPAFLVGRARPQRRRRRWTEPRSPRVTGTQWHVLARIIPEGVRDLSSASSVVQRGPALTASTMGVPVVCRRWRVVGLVSGLCKWQLVLIDLLT